MKLNKKRSHESTFSVQSTIESCQKRKKNKVTQDALDEAIINVIIEDNVPRNIIHRDAFRNLVELLAPEDIKVTGKDKVSDRINKRFDVMKTNLKKELSNQTDIGTTADLYTKGKR